MNEINRALSDIAEIRDRMAVTSQFRGFAPEILVVSGIGSLALVLVQWFWPHSLVDGDVGQVMLWGSLLLVTGLAIAAEAVVRAQSRHGAMAPAMLQSAMRSVVPPGAASFIIAVAICRHAPEAAWAIPGIWLLLIGIAAFSSYSNLPRSILWAGLWFAVTGTGVIFLAGARGEAAGWMIGIPLAVGHLLIARVLRETARDAHG